jgi:secreted trypsin-like serine protease
MMMASIFLITFLTIFQLQNPVIYSCNHNTSCGCSNKVRFYSKIVGGQNARIQTWNWVVSLHVRNKFQCAGSILSSTWILTAAHCFAIINNSGAKVFQINPSDVTVYAGSINRYEENQLRRVAKIYLHPKFDESNFINDIALLKLSSALPMTDVTLAKICLPNVFRNEYPPIGSLVSRFFD